jgi:hypothetical protein
VLLCAEGHVTCNVCIGVLFRGSLARPFSDLSASETLRGTYDVCCEAMSAYCAAPYDSAQLRLVLSETQRRDLREAECALRTHTRAIVTDEMTRAESTRAAYRRADGSFAALMCPRCSFGPIELFACPDIRAHHEQEVPSASGAETRINNACARCGFLGEQSSEYPAWDGRCAVIEPKVLLSAPHC